MTSNCNWDGLYFYKIFYRLTVHHRVISREALRIDKRRVVIESHLGKFHTKFLHLQYWGIHWHCLKSVWLYIISYLQTRSFTEKVLFLYISRHYLIYVVDYQRHFYSLSRLLTNFCTICDNLRTSSYWYVADLYNHSTNVYILFVHQGICYFLLRNYRYIQSRQLLVFYTLLSRRLWVYIFLVNSLLYFLEAGMKHH